LKQLDKAEEKSEKGRDLRKSGSGIAKPRRTDQEETAFIVDGEKRELRTGRNIT